jgi:Ca2+-binding RTX toxin-like protein
MQKSTTIESLESRRLLAGVTLLSHGYAGNVDGWVQKTADGIVARLGGPANASVYTMKIRADSNGALSVTEFTPDAGYGDYRDNAEAELIIKHDWSNISSGAYSTGQVAEATALYLLAPRTSTKLPPIAELPLHLAGHSRGASLIAELSRLVGQRGAVVDQVSYLDPHPVDGVDDIFGADFQDAAMAVYDNTVFADDYWRTDGNSQDLDPDGEPVDGAHQGDLNASVQQSFLFTAHNAVTAYYVGTVDLQATSGGDHPIHTVWYESPNPARDETGYLFSRIGGGTRPSDGLGAIGRGAASRAPTGQQGTQFPSVVEIKPKGGYSSFQAGQVVNVTLRAGQRGGSANVTLFLDADRNPYNGIGRQVNSTSFSGAVSDRTLAILDTATLPTGSYVLGAKLQADGGETRYVYGRRLTVTASTPVGSISGRILTINATEQADTVSLQPGEAGQLVAAVNDRSSAFDQADFDRIEVYLQGGNDTFAGNDGIVTPTYVLGGDGADVITGGGGQDTLSGGADKNTLSGAAGDDRLNGSGGPESLSGGPGEDRLYGNGGDDRLDGGKGIDRLFGGDGADALVGGESNDKLYGENNNDTLFGNAGADIADGGPGTDSSEDDPLDLRTSIEILL